MSNRGPLGGSGNSPLIDEGTLVRTASRAPGPVGTVQTDDARYPWELPQCRPDQPPTDYNYTTFEKQIQTDFRWKEVFDDATGRIIGYIRKSGGFVQMVDREGTVAFQDEIPIEPSWFSPIDLIGGGGGGMAARRVGTRASELLAKLVGSRVARKTVDALRQALVNMKRVAERIGKAAAHELPSQTAKRLVDTMRKTVGKVIVDLGGTGKVNINLNSLAAQQTKGVPNLIKAAGETIGEVFPAGSIDELVSSNMVHGTIDWAKALAGAFKAMKPGGKVSIAPYISGNVQAHLAEIKLALEAAKFRDIRIIAGKMIEALR